MDKTSCNIVVSIAALVILHSSVQALSNPFLKGFENKEVAISTLNDATAMFFSPLIFDQGLNSLKITIPATARWSKPTVYSCKEWWDIIIKTTDQFIRSASKNVVTRKTNTDIIDMWTRMRDFNNTIVNTISVTCNAYLKQKPITAEALQQATDLMSTLTGMRADIITHANNPAIMAMRNDHAPSLSSKKDAIDVITSFSNNLVTIIDRVSATFNEKKIEIVRNMPKDTPIASAALSSNNTKDKTMQLITPRQQELDLLLQPRTFVSPQEYQSWVQEINAINQQIKIVNQKQGLVNQQKINALIKQAKMK